MAVRFNPINLIEMTMQIRQSDPSDFKMIGQVHFRAFGDDEGPEIVALVGELFDDPSALPLLSLVAVCWQL